jgi:hypothetical protein
MVVYACMCVWCVAVLPFALTRHLTPKPSPHPPPHHLPTPLTPTRLPPPPTCAPPVVQAESGYLQHGAAYGWAGRGGSSSPIPVPLAGTSPRGPHAAAGYTWDGRPPRDSKRASRKPKKAAKDRKKHKSRKDRHAGDAEGGGVGGSRGEAGDPAGPGVAAHGDGGATGGAGTDSDYCSGSDLSMTGYAAALKLRQVSSGDRGRGEV